MRLLAIVLTGAQLVIYVFGYMDDDLARRRYELRDPMLFLIVAQALVLIELLRSMP